MSHSLSASTTHNPYQEALTPERTVPSAMANSGSFANASPGSAGLASSFQQYPEDDPHSPFGGMVKTPLSRSLTRANSATNFSPNASVHELDVPLDSPLPNVILKRRRPGSSRASAQPSPYDGSLSASQTLGQGDPRLSLDEGPTTVLNVPGSMVQRPPPMAEVRGIARRNDPSSAYPGNGSGSTTFDPVNYNGGQPLASPSVPPLPQEQQDWSLSQSPSHMSAAAAAGTPPDLGMGEASIEHAELMAKYNETKNRIFNEENSVGNEPLIPLNSPERDPGLGGPQSPPAEMGERPLPAQNARANLSAPAAVDGGISNVSSGSKGQGRGQGQGVKAVGRGRVEEDEEDDYRRGGRVGRGGGGAVGRGGFQHPYTSQMSPPPMPFVPPMGPNGLPMPMPAGTFPQQQQQSQPQAAGGYPGPVSTGLPYAAMPAGPAQGYAPPPAGVATTVPMPQQYSPQGMGYQYAVQQTNSAPAPQAVGYYPPQPQPQTTHMRPPPSGGMTMPSAAMPHPAAGSRLISNVERKTNAKKAKNQSQQQQQQQGQQQQQQQEQTKEKPPKKLKKALLSKSTGLKWVVHNGQLCFESRGMRMPHPRGAPLPPEAEDLWDRYKRGEDVSETASSSWGRGSEDQDFDSLNRSPSPTQSLIPRPMGSPKARSGQGTGQVSPKSRSGSGLPVKDGSVSDGLMPPSSSHTSKTPDGSTATVSGPPRPVASHGDAQPAISEKSN